MSAESDSKNAVLAGASAEGKRLAVELLPRIASLAQQIVLGNISIDSPPPANDLDRALHDSRDLKQKTDVLVKELMEARAILNTAIETATKFVITTALGFLA